MAIRPGTEEKTQGPHWTPSRVRSKFAQGRLSTSLGMTVGLRLAKARSHLSKSAKGGDPGGRVQIRCAPDPSQAQDDPLQMGKLKLSQYRNWFCRALLDWAPGSAPT